MMSYDIYLVDANGSAIEFDQPHHLTGGTYQIGGCSEAWLNVTWNYASDFAKFIDGDKGIRWLYGQKARDTIPRLATAIANMKNDEDEDYWMATEGNARRALINLLNLAIMAPDGIWKGD